MSGSSTRPSDPLFADQWHLDGSALGTVDLNVLPAWADYTGRGVRIAVIDTSIEATHPDLAPNYDASLELPDDPVRLPDASSNHGTATAGLIAAARNGIGSVGVAYDARITQLPILANDTGLHGQTRVDDVFDALSRFDVAAHVWALSFPFTAGSESSGWTRMHEGLAHSVVEGRDGLGTVSVVSSGNDRRGGPEADANMSGIAASRFVIAVGAVGKDGEVARYSNPSAALLVVAPSSASFAGDITTTDRTGPAGYGGGDWFGGFGGTSTSGPLVAGVVALMLEANPDLGWRDVQDILALSARHAGHAIGGSPTSPEQNPWRINGAGDWNGGGMHFSNDYGFGLVDAHAAVRLAETWRAPARTSANEMTLAANWRGSQVVPDNDPMGFSFSFEITGAMRVEQVSLRADIVSGIASQVDIRLVSPDGTRMDLAPNSGGSVIYKPWTFGAAGFRGESATGTWRVEIRDERAGAPLTVRSLDLGLFGAADSADDHYIYTDAFAGLAGQDGRNLLTDAAGHDLLNAAATTGPLLIDLRPGFISTIAGESLTIGAGTLIEDAIGGDGNDILRGNAADNRLEGMRGKDRLFGYAGADTLLGGDGDDVLTGGAGGDLLVGGAGLDRVVYTTQVRLDLLTPSLNTGEAQGDVLQGIEHIWGSAMADTLAGSDLGDVLLGQAGDDWLFGRDGVDRLLGGDGNDRLEGGAGSDALTGGTGRDLFVLEPRGARIDRILDFTTGEDRILLTGTGLPEGRMGKVRFAYEGEELGTERIVYDRATGLLSHDIDGGGSAAPVALALLVGAPTLVLADLLIG
ncbi:S8 family serine peptidase [Falsiroseomonas tokyonensis]|uniref:S8 family serine peptidase n=1 Tax=Falsiroseomonas tokyonensis TaxID=430521 RepID=A0ABV7C021_9PROT|nr:S8 family serine peptidase [Falsiroseomonas tokyonensis]MBU8539653.1 S8 family serine peptidase [Falsiroseomonas tokyonensis]